MEPPRMCRGVATPALLRRNENLRVYRIDLRGKKINHLKVLGLSATPPGSSVARTLCRCDCGRRVEITSHRLRSGEAFSCGCISRRPRSAVPSHSHLYRKWKHIIESGECCARWRTSVEAFAHDVGARPKGHGLSRVDHARAWAPGNVRWVPSPEAPNTRSVLLTHRGEVATMSQWARRLGITRQAIWFHLHRGKPFTELAEKHDRRRPARGARAGGRRAVRQRARPSRHS